MALEFDPLAFKPAPNDEIAINAIKREIQNISDSYVGWYDPFIPPSGMSDSRRGFPSGVISDSMWRIKDECDGSATWPGLRKR